MFAAYSGDVSALRRYTFSFILLQIKIHSNIKIKILIFFLRIALSAINMELTDYDTRTALHVASAEGN